MKDTAIAFLSSWITRDDCTIEDLQHSLYFIGTRRLRRHCRDARECDPRCLSRSDIKTWTRRSSLSRMCSSFTLRKPTAAAITVSNKCSGVTVLVHVNFAMILAFAAS